MEDISLFGDFNSLFEDFKEGRRGRRRRRKAKESKEKCNKTCQLIKEIQANQASNAVQIQKINEDISKVVTKQVDTNNALVNNRISTLNEQNNLNNTLSTATPTETPTITNFTTREGFDDLHTGNKLINFNDDSNMIYYLKSIQNQNKSLNDNTNYLGGNFSSDNQKFLYQQQHILYWTAVNFWMFYIYMVLAVVYGLILFIFKEGGLGMKIFWYLHVFFYPYLAIYCEIALFLFFMYVYCWVVGQPFTVWRYFTSYPSIV
jgi:hypothetical protein